MQKINVDYLFRELKYSKDGGTIAQAARNKLEKLTSKIADRKTRIARTREQFAIDDNAMILLLQQALNRAKNYDSVGASNGTLSYTNSKTQQVSEVEHGVVSQLHAEQQAIDSEMDQVKLLETIARNLVSTKDYDLTYDELTYLGF